MSNRIESLKKIMTVKAELSQNIIKYSKKGLIKTMWRLYREEMKRILRSRSTLLFLAAALGLSVFMAWVPVTFERYTYEENGQEITIEGQEALALNKAMEAPSAGEVTPEKLAEGLSYYHKNLNIYGDFYAEDFPLNLKIQEIYPWRPLLLRLHEAMADPVSGLAPEYTQITEADALAFYDRCQSHIADLMHLEQRDNPAAQQTAIRMYEKVKGPFYYYPGYGSNMAEYEGMYLFMLMFLCVMITAPLFCCEYQTGADDILRSTRHGRRRLALVKILSALTIGVAAFIPCMTIFQIISNSLFGWECRWTSIQILFSVVSLLPLNVGELQNFVILAGFITMLSSVCFVLFLSSACRNTTIATGLTIASAILPTLFYMMIGGNLGSCLRVLLPSGGLGGSNAFLYALIDFEFLKIGPLSIWVPWLILAVPLLEIPLFLWMTVRTYCKRSL